MVPIAVAGDRVFTQGTGQSQQHRLGRESGRWQAVVVESYRRRQRQRAGGRDRAARRPWTVIASTLLTENGDLMGLRVQDGTQLWHRNILKDFGGRNIGWLLSESPLIDGDHVIVDAGWPRAPAWSRSTR